MTTAEEKLRKRCEELTEALVSIRSHVFATLPAERAPAGNRLQVVASIVDNVLAEDEYVVGLGPRDSTLAATAAEMRRARKKFPGNKKMLAALMEECGELARALLQRKPKVEVEKEAIQVAATVLRIYEEGDADFLEGEWGDQP